MKLKRLKTIIVYILHIGCYQLFRAGNRWKIRSVVDGKRNSGLECLVKKGGEKT